MLGLTAHWRWAGKRAVAHISRMVPHTNSYRKAAVNNLTAHHLSALSTKLSAAISLQPTHGNHPRKTGDLNPAVKSTSRTIARRFVLNAQLSATESKENGQTSHRLLLACLVLIRTKADTLISFAKLSEGRFTN